MPIYEYHCRQCDFDFERLVRSPADKVKCPECAGQRVRRKPSVFATSSPGKQTRQRPTSSGCTSCRASSCAGCHK